MCYGCALVQGWNVVQMWSVQFGALWYHFTRCLALRRKSCLFRVTTFQHSAAGRRVPRLQEMLGSKQDTPRQKAGTKFADRSLAQTCSDFRLRWYCPFANVVGDHRLDLCCLTTHYCARPPYRRGCIFLQSDSSSGPSRLFKIGR